MCSTWCGWGLAGTQQGQFACWLRGGCPSPRTGFGSIAQTLRQAQARDPRGYNSFVPLEPMNQLQVDLADMKALGASPTPSCWWPLMR